MKVLHLIKSLGRGGAEMLLPETIAVHDSAQFEFHCIYFLPWKNQMVAALKANGVKVTCMNASNNIRIMTKLSAIHRYCKTHQIDLIHCHLPWAGFVGRVVHKISGIPVIYTEHNKQERYNKITARLNNLSFNWQNLAIAVSGDVASSIQHNIHPAIPVTTVLNGVNTEKFVRDEKKGSAIRKEYGIEPDSMVIGTLAVFRFQKRLCEWLEQVKLLTDQYPGLRAVLVGDGPLKEEIVARRDSLGLRDKVLMPGLQTNTVDWYSAMDIFMMSSEFEGLPIALLEAMSCSSAVVCTSAGGIKEVIRHNEDGLLVEVNDWNKLSEQVGRLIDDRQLLAQKKIAARKRVVDSFSLQTMVNQLETIYKKTTSPATTLNEKKSYQVN